MADRTRKPKSPATFNLSRAEAVELVRLLADYEQLVRARVIENIVKHGVVTGMRMNTNIHLEPALTCAGLLRALDREGFTRG